MSTFPLLLKTIGEVFASKADHHEMGIVSAFFAARPDLFQQLYESKHEVFLGRRGTGKTMVLKHLSFDSQLYRSKVPISHQTFAVDFVGFYTSLALEDQPSIGPEHDGQFGAIFGHWFNLVTLVPVLDVLAIVQNSPKITTNAANRFAHQVGTQLFGLDSSDLPSLRGWVGEQEKTIRDCCSWTVPMSLVRVHEYLQRLPIITSTRTFHRDLSSLLSNLLNPLFSGEPQFSFLLDRFDEVCAERQQVLQYIIQVRPQQMYYVKLGVTHPTKLHLLELTSQDYRILNIEHDVNSSTYQSFCETVLQRRFAVIRDKLTQRGFDANIVELFNDPTRLLPNLPFEEQARHLKAPSHGQIGLWAEAPGDETQAFQKLLAVNQTPLFSGIEHLAALSSGCTRIFIEITHRVITHALIERLQLILAEHAIPPDLQHRAIEIETEQRYSQELKTNISATIADPELRSAAHNLLDWLLRQFAKSIGSASVVAHCFTIQNSLPLGNERVQRLHGALSVLDLLGLITQRTLSGAKPSDSIFYSVAQTFAPKYKTPPLELGCLTTTSEDLLVAIDPYWGSRRAEPMLPLTEMLTCFYATGFRHPWENAVRDHFRVVAFPQNDLRYVDGEGEHSRSRQIGRAVQNLISTADFLIAEISDFNENVCFEMGQCVAIERWFYGIKHRLHKKEAPNKTIKEMFESLKYDAYELPPEPTQHGVPETWNFNSVSQVVKTISSRYRKLSDKKKRGVNPWDSENRLGLIQMPTQRTIFMFADNSERCSTWLTEFKNKIMTELRSMVTRDQGASYSGPYTLKYLEAIARSSHCVIDITNKNPFCAFLLGYAVGRGKKHLAVWHRGTDSLITNYRGEAGKNEYDNKEELWHAIQEFMQRSP